MFSDKRLMCTTSGDPHYNMFSRSVAHPMGGGLYTMVQIPDFRIQVCHQPTSRPDIAINAGFAIQFDGGVVKILPSGVYNNGSAVQSGNTFTFPGGEVVRGSYRSLTVTVPRPRYINRVIGLCGEYKYGAGGVLDGVTEVYTQASGQPFQWGGPFQGLYQSEYVEGLRVPEAEALLTRTECPYEAPEPAPPVPGCPELLPQAEAECPVGECYDNCKGDVVEMCDLGYIDRHKEACGDREELDPEPGALRQAGEGGRSVAGPGEGGSVGPPNVWVPVRVGRLLTGTIGAMKSGAEARDQTGQTLCTDSQTNASSGDPSWRCFPKRRHQSWGGGGLCIHPCAAAPSCRMGPDSRPKRCVARARQ